METKKALSIGALLAIALGVVVAIGIFSKDPNPVVPEEEAHVEPETLSFVSLETGISFKYPEMYRLEGRDETYEGMPLKVIVLVDSEAVVPDMSEGPTSISVIVAENPTNMPVEEWVRTHAISNFQLSTNETFTPTTVGGEAGVRYRHSGLYENDAVAVAREGKIYLFSVGWIAEDQPIRHDFEHLIGSVEFI